MVQVISSSGINGAPFARAAFADKIMAYVWEADFLKSITNTDIIGDVTFHNQTVQVLKQPETSDWRPYEKGQGLIADQISPDMTCVTVDQSYYKAISITKVDILQAGSDWSEWEVKFLESVYQSLVALRRNYVFNSMIAQVNPGNTGNNAGIYQMVQLGAPGAPYAVTPANVVNALANIQQVLQDRLRWQEGNMFIIVPNQFMATLANSPYANASIINDGRSFLIDGKMAKELFGFMVIPSIHTKTVKDTTGALCHYIIAGNRNAFAYTAAIVDARVMPQQNDFAYTYQMLDVHGGKAMYDDALVVAYWTLSAANN